MFLASCHLFTFLKSSARKRFLAFNLLTRNLDRQCQCPSINSSSSRQTTPHSLPQPGSRQDRTTARASQTSPRNCSPASASLPLAGRGAVGARGCRDRGARRGSVRARLPGGLRAPGPRPRPPRRPHVGSGSRRPAAAPRLRGAAAGPGLAAGAAMWREAGRHVPHTLASRGSALRSPGQPGTRCCIGRERARLKRRCPGRYGAPSAAWCALGCAAARRSRRSASASGS